MHVNIDRMCRRMCRNITSWYLSLTYKQQKGVCNLLVLKYFFSESDFCTITSHLLHAPCHCTVPVHSPFALLFHGGSQTCMELERDCFNEISKHWEESWKYNTQRRIFDEIRGVLIANEALSWVFDISSQSKQKPRGVWKVQLSKSMLTKTLYPNLLHSCDFLCLNYQWVWELYIIVCSLIKFVT